MQRLAIFLLVLVLAGPVLADEFNFVAYNLKNYLKMDRRVDGESLKNAPKPDTEITALVAMLKECEPDVLGVCEIGQREDLADLQRRLKAAGIDLPHSEWMKGFDNYRCLGLLSRYPIVARNHQSDLKYQLGDKFMDFRRGIFDATVQVNPDYALRIMGIHFKSKREINEADQALMRRNEASLLRTHVDAVLNANPDTNLIVFGDFNDTRNERPVREVQGRFGSKNYLADIQLADKHGYRWTYYWRYGDQYSRFDFAMVSKALYPEVIQEKSRLHYRPDWFTASDHRPLVVRVSDKDRETP